MKNVSTQQFNSKEPITQKLFEPKLATSIAARLMYIYYRYIYISPQSTVILGSSPVISNSRSGR